jgi:hypothetical protein
LCDEFEDVERIGAATGSLAPREIKERCQMPKAELAAAAVRLRVTSASTAFLDGFADKIKVRAEVRLAVR